MNPFKLLEAIDEMERMAVLEPHDPTWGRHVRMLRREWRLHNPVEVRRLKVLQTNRKLAAKAAMIATRNPEHAHIIQVEPGVYRIVERRNIKKTDKIVKIL